LPAGDKVVAIGRNEGNNWVQVQYGSTTGWVAGWLTVYSGDTALLPIASSVNPQPVGGPAPLDMTSPFNVNMRSNPDTKAGLVVMIPFHAHASAIGRTNSSSWVNVNYDGTTGWVARWLVILSGDVNVLPVTSGETPEETPIFATEPADGTPAVIPTVSGTPSSEGSPIPPPPDGGIAVKTPGKANIRSAPSSEAPIIGVMSYSDINAVAVGQNASRNWLQVVNGGTSGWVARWVVLTSDSTAGLPITSDNGEVLPVPGGSAVLVKGIYDIFIRSGPGTNYGSLAALPAYTSVTANARTANNDWVKVSFQNVEGWVAAWVITASGDYTNLPVEETGVP
jgi:N-acetylmuramoyl-L-alanine amidase